MRRAAHGRQPAFRPVSGLATRNRRLPEPEVQWRVAGPAWTCGRDRVPVVAGGPSGRLAAEVAGAGGCARGRLPLRGQHRLARPAHGRQGSLFPVELPFRQGRKGRAPGTCASVGSFATRVNAAPVVFCHNSARVLGAEGCNFHAGTRSETLSFALCAPAHRLESRYLTFIPS
ncbi:hypothetical protein D9M72_465630 [compost metagenome]